MAAVDVDRNVGPINVIWQWLISKLQNLRSSPSVTGEGHARIGRPAAVAGSQHPRLRSY